MDKIVPMAFRWRWMALAGVVFSTHHSTRTHVLVTSCIRMAGLDTLLDIDTKQWEGVRQTFPSTRSWTSGQRLNQQS